MTPRPAPDEAPHGATVIASLTNGNPWTRPLPDKVPETSAIFWTLTILASIVGVKGADLVSTELGLGLGLGMSATTAIVSLVVTGTLMLQLSTHRHVPGLYWLTVVLLSVLGALIADDLINHLGIGLWVANTGLGLLLVTVWAGWRRSEPLSGLSVLTRRGEVWYWFAVLCTFSLATATSALISRRLVSGYSTAVLLVVGLTAIREHVLARHRHDPAP